MKARVDREEFADLLSWVHSSRSLRHHLPSLSAARIEATEGRLSLRATDLESVVDAWMPATVGEPGVTLAPSQLAASLAARLPDDGVDLTVTDSRLRMTSGPADFDLRALDLDGWPDVDVDRDGGHALPGGFVPIVATTVANVATGEKPVKQTCRLEADGETLTAVATDGYRLARYRVPWDGPEGDVNLPMSIFAALGKVDGIPALTMGEDRATFTYGDRSLSSTLMDVQYPDWPQLLPDSHETVATVDSGALADAAKRALLLTSYTKTNQPTVLAFTDGEVRLKTATQDRGESDEAVPVDLDGEPIEVRVNAKFLVDALSGCGDGPVVIGLRDRLRPMTLNAVDDEAYVHLLMVIKDS